MKLKRIFIAMLMVAGATSAMGQQMQQLPVDPKVRVGKLDNGLTYYIRHNEEPKDQAAFYIAHKVGSVQEDDNQLGLAHFLEHMAFNGSKHFPAGSVFGFIQRIGVTQFNAETGIDMTYYHLDNAPVTDPVIVDSCLLLLSDWSCQVELTQKEIDQERDVIHGEYRMRDNAQQRMLTKLLPQLYPGSKYSDRMPIGKMEIIDNFSPEFLEAYYKKWYHPSIQAVIVVGDVDTDRIEAKIKELFGPLKNPENEAPYELYPVPDNEQAIYAIESDKEQPQTTLSYYFKHAPIPTELRGTTVFIANQFTKSIVMSCLNQRFQELALKADCPFVLAQVSDGQYLVSKTCDAFDLTVMPKPGKSAEATKAAMTEIARVRQHGFTAGEIQRASDEFVATVEAIYNNREKQPNRYYAQQYLSHFLMGDAIPDIETELQIYKMCTQLPVEVYQHYLMQLTQSTERNFVLMAMCSESDTPEAAQLKAAVKSGFEAQTEAYVDETNDEPLIAQMPTPVKVQKEAAAPFGYTKWTLPNGANVYYRQTDFSDDEVTMRAISKGGYNKLSDQDAYLSRELFIPTNGMEIDLFELIASETGLPGFTNNDLRKKLAGKKVSLGMTLTDDTDELKGSSSLRDLRTLFELTHLAFQGECNDPAAYASMLSQMEMVIPQLDAMHAVIQRDSMYNTAFNHNPRRQMLHTSTLKNIDYDHVRKVIASRYTTAGDFDFIFTGPMNADTLRTMVEQYIAPLQGTKKRETFTDQKIRSVKGIVDNTYECAMADAESAETIIGVRWTCDAPYNQKDAIVVRALGSILGDRYFQKIREEGSMGYSAGANGSSIIGHQQGYRISASTNIKPERKDEAMAILHNEIEEIGKNGVTAEEIKKFLEPLQTGYAQSQRSNEYWSNMLANKLLWNIDFDTNYLATAQSITSADIQNFVKKKMLKKLNRVTVTMVPAE